MESFRERYGQNCKVSVLVSGAGGDALLLLFPVPDKTRKEEKFSKIQIWILNKCPTVVRASLLWNQHPSLIWVEKREGFRS